MPDRFEALITRPLPSTQETARLALGQRLKAVRWSTTLPGGYDTADVTMDMTAPDRDAWLSDSAFVQHWSHLWIGSADFTAFEGRVYRLDRSQGGQVGAFSARGYGMLAMQDQPYVSFGYTDTSGNILLRSIVNCAPLLVAAPVADFWQDPLVSHIDTEFNGRYPSQIVEQLMREGGNTGNPSIPLPWDFAVWEGRRAWFLPRQQPAITAVPYEFPLDGVVNWVEDSGGMYGALAVSYTQLGTNTQKTLASQTAPGFVDTYGIARTANIQGGSVTDVSAAQYQATQLQIVSIPQTSISVRYQGDAGVPTPWGGRQPLYKLRAGEWCTVGGEGPFIIIHTDYDAQTQSFSATLQSYPDHFLQQLQSMYEVQRLLILGQNATTAGQR